MSQTEQLNDQLAAARATLMQALVDGGDSAGIRAQIADIEARITETEKALASAAIEIVRIEEAATDVAGVELADQTHDSIVAATTIHGLEEFAGEALPAVDRNPQVDHAARAVARSQANLTKAEAEYQPHADKLKLLQSRLNEKTAELEVLKQRRFAGDAKVTDAAEATLLTADIEAIAQLIDTAKQQATAADRRQTARDALAAANAELDRLKRVAVFEASKARVAQAEALFMTSWRQMIENGRGIGKHSPWAEYQASPEMKRAVTGAIVPGFRGGF